MSGMRNARSHGHPDDSDSGAPSTAFGDPPAASFASIPTLADYLVNGYWAWSGYQGTGARSWDHSSISVNLQDLNATEQAIALQALSLWHDVCNVSFSVTTGTADITYINDGSGLAVTSYSVSGGTLSNATVQISSDWAGGPLSGNYFFQTYVHETGHALGLGHQGPYNTSGVYGVDNIYTNDTWRWSVMSYFSQSSYGSDTFDFPLTPEMADIYAVQSIYGAQTTRVGDTTYGFNSTAGSFYDFATYSSAPAFTLYDTGGIDTLDASGYSDDQSIDLRPGDWSSIGGETNNVGIYLATTIENAIGGSGNDRINGNDVANSLYGNAANDTLEGAGDSDVLNGGAGNDTASYANAPTGVAVALVAGPQNTGGAGTDTLVSIENITGSSFNDTLTGNGGANILLGLGGADWLVGGAGDDMLDGGAGSDTASYADAPAGVAVALVSGVQNTGGAGNDTLISVENLTGSSFNDILTANAGNNTLDGGAGDDTLNGDAGNDTATYAGAGTGVTVALIAGPQNTGGAGIDMLVSVENLTGSTFNDILTGNAGANSLRGGDGDDWLAGGLGDDTLNGGAGNDTASYAGATAGITVSLISGAQDTGGAGSDALIGIENLTGSRFNDVLTGNAGANVLRGNGGDDTLDGGAGNDTASYIGADAGVTVALITGAQNTIGAGNDTLVSIENLTGSNLDDTLTGSGGANVLLGLNGNDTLRGGPGTDMLAGGGGIDTASYADAVAGVTVVLMPGAQSTGGAGIDTLSGIENLTGSSFNDTLRGNALANTLAGEEGDDTLIGRSGDDVLLGGNGDDLLVGGFGRDIMTGGAGADIFDFNASGETGATAATRDQIIDFTQGTDLIDLSTIDANTTVAGNQAFAFIGTAAFHGVAGELRQSTGATTIVMGDTNGDGAADFQIQLNGSFMLTAANVAL